MRTAPFVVAAALALAACESHHESTRPMNDSMPVASRHDYSMTPTTPSANYPLKTCVVSGDTLGAGRVAYRCDGTEVQFCCNGCVKEFQKDPERYLSKVRSAQ